MNDRKTLQAAIGKALGQGDFTLAAHLLVEAIELSPTDSRLYEQLVRVALLGGATATAVQAALELRRLDLNNPQFGHLHAMTLLAHGDEASAEGVLEQVLVVAPAHVESCRALAQLARARREPSRAVALLEGPARATPGDLPLNVEFAQSLFEADRAAEARAVLEPLVTSPSCPHAAVLLLARCCAKLGERAAALTLARRAKDTDDAEVREQAILFARPLEN